MCKDLIETIILSTLLIASVPVVVDEMVDSVASRNAVRYLSMRTKIMRWFRGKPVTNSDENAARVLLDMSVQQDGPSLMECLYTESALMQLSEQRHEAREKKLTPIPAEPVLGSEFHRPWTRRSHKSLIVTLSQEAKNKFPIHKKTEANYLVVRRYIYDRLIEHGVRPAHIRSVIEMATALSFVPDKFNHAVVTFESTAQVNIAHEVNEEARTNNSGFASLLNWTTYRETRQGFAAA